MLEAKQNDCYQYLKAAQQNQRSPVPTQSHWGSTKSLNLQWEVALPRSLRSLPAFQGDVPREHVLDDQDTNKSMTECVSDKVTH